MESSKWSNVNISKGLYLNEDFLSSTTAQRPQPQVSDRHQVDDVDSSNTSRTSITPSSRGAAAIAAAATASTSDEHGPLPPGWQLSRTENERVFFIDHINKRTTWVRLFLKRIQRIYFDLFDRLIHELVNRVHYQLHNVN